MARHKLTLAEQLAGIRAALASRRTPSRLKPSLRRRMADLERRVGKRADAKVRKPKFLGWFEL